MRNIKRLFHVADTSLFMTCGTLDYDRVTDAVIAIANRVHAYQGETEELWWMESHGAGSLSDFIVGAFWHYTQWHGGQDSKGYAALSALGQVFSPGMSMPEEENETYQALNNMAEE